MHRITTPLIAAIALIIPTVMTSNATLSQECHPRDTHKLSAPSNDYRLFGAAVAISGDTALIGATGGSSFGASPSSAYTYRHDGQRWRLNAELIPSNRQDEDYLGTSVAIYRNVAIVGAPGAPHGSTITGAAYIFRYNGARWIEEAQLLASDGESGDHFGKSVATSGNTVIIGAHSDNHNGIPSGSA